MEPNSLENTQAALQQIQENLTPAMGYERGQAESVLQAEVEAGSTQVQDQTQANLITSGVDGVTAEAAASVLAQEAIDPSERRSFAEQHVVMEAYVQLQQEVQLAEAQERAEGVEADPEMQERVAIVAPIIVDTMNVMETHELEGEHHTAHFDLETQQLVVMEQGREQPLLKAQWDGQEWRDLGSNLSQEQVGFFRDEMQPQVEQLARQREQERERELWIEVG
ncbi:MAG: hypothetical protein MUF49_10770 [Oculatellaceae cyanobacterium Prado106]|jgi:hypothetical protein|nr:hypothetical protein [Oculatellaceae cyanobacterium Prado106]